MIRLTRVRKEYPRTGTALHDVSLLVNAGEFVFLTGPSGAGKSTLLKLIFADEFPTSGEVKVGNVSSATMRRRDIATLRRKLGIVFQDFRLLEDRTVEANVGFALEVTGELAHPLRDAELVGADPRGAEPRLDEATGRD